MKITRRQFLAGLSSSSVIVGSAISGASCSEQYESNDNVEIIRDVEYGDLDKQNLDFFLPRQGKKLIDENLTPVVMVIPSGAWIYSDKSSLEGYAFSLAEEGYAAATLNYRAVLDGYKWPAMIDDCKLALEWIINNGKDYSIDNGRIAALGPSAGAHLSLLLATMPETRGKMRSVASFYGPTDEKETFDNFKEKKVSTLNSKLPVSTLNPKLPFSHYINKIKISISGEESEKAVKNLKNAFMSNMILYFQEIVFGASSDENPEIYDSASPIYYLETASPGSKFPSMLLVHGMKDHVVNIGQIVNFENTARDLRVDVETLYLDDADHGFMEVSWYLDKNGIPGRVIENMMGDIWGYARESWDVTKDFLNRRL